MIQKFLILTSFPPFLQIYLAIYKALIGIATFIFRKYPEVKAVYLRRGCAKEEILPGISDIDFAVIEEGMDEEKRRKLISAYQMFARITILPDQILEVYDKETFYKQYNTSYNQYRFMEGKATWKLLYGKDLLADLPTLPLEKLYGGLYNEIKIWWTVFSWQLLQGRRFHDNVVIRNSVCYKVTSEILKMLLALNYEILTFIRSEALDLIKQHLTNKERILIEKLESTSKRRFHISDKVIVEETKDFLLTHLNHFCKTLRNHPIARSLEPISQRVDCSKDESFWNEKVSTHVCRVLEHVKREWAPKYKGAYLGLGVHFDLDELLIMLEVDPKCLPSVEEVKEVLLLHWDTEPLIRSQIHLYLLLPHVALQLDTDYLKGSSRKSIVCGLCNPDLFSLLWQHDFTLEEGGYKPSINALWTPLIKTFLREKQEDFYRKLETPTIYKSNSLDFLKIFWKTLQLVLINRSVQKGEVLYPLTLPAIERALELEGFSLPSLLKPLSTAYYNATKGKSSDIKAYMREAICYLKDIL